jgi:hypothetical protein
MQKKKKKKKKKRKFISGNYTKTTSVSKGVALRPIFFWQNICICFTVVPSPNKIFV